MTAGAADKKIKLSDAQRQALRKLYTEKKTGKQSWDRIPQATVVALYNLGLMSGEYEEKTRRDAARVLNANVNDAGMALAEQLFGMNWWSELISAFISHERTKQVNNERMNASLEIARELNLDTELDLSGNKTLGYRGVYTSELIEIRVSKTSFNLRENGYVLQPKIKPFNMTENEARLVAQLLTDAANVLAVFKKAAQS